MSLKQRWANYGLRATCGLPSAFFAARQKLLGSKNNFVYDCPFVYDILIDIVLFITVSHYVTSFSKCMCFSAYIPLCVLRKYLATYYAALERLRICEYGPCTQKFAHPCIKTNKRTNVRILFCRTRKNLRLQFYYYGNVLIKNHEKTISISG